MRSDFARAVGVDRAARSAGPRVQFESSQETLLRELATNETFRRSVVAVKFAGEEKRYVRENGADFVVGADEEFTLVVDAAFEVPAGATIKVLYTDHLHRIDGNLRTSANFNMVAGFSDGSFGVMGVAVCTSTSGSIISAVIAELADWCEQRGTTFEPVVHVHDCKFPEYAAVRRVLPSCTRHHYCTWHLITALKPRFHRRFMEDCAERGVVGDAASGLLRQAWAAWTHQLIVVCPEVRAGLLESFVSS